MSSLFSRERFGQMDRVLETDFPQTGWPGQALNHSGLTSSLGAGEPGSLPTTSKNLQQLQPRPQRPSNRASTSKNVSYSLTLQIRAFCLCVAAPTRNLLCEHLKPLKPKNRPNLHVLSQRYEERKHLHIRHSDMSHNCTTESSCLNSPQMLRFCIRAVMLKPSF